MRELRILVGATLGCCLAACGSGHIGETETLVGGSVAGPDPSQVPGSEQVPAGHATAKPQGVTCSSRMAGPANLARLTVHAYRNTVEDLFPGVSLDWTQLTLPAEVWTDGFLNNAQAQSASPELVERLSANAQAIAEAVTADLTKALPCSFTSPTEAIACGKKFLAASAQRIFRRPLLDDEKIRYEAAFEAAYGQWGMQNASAMLLEAMLSSPQFLYRLEAAATDPSGVKPLPPYELASRLSYFLTDTTPDAELLKAAADANLTGDQELEKQARRLLGTARAREALANFHSQWLRFDKLDNLRKSADSFPQFTPQMAGFLREATALWADHLFWEGDHTTTGFLTDSHVYVNDALAPLYGVSSPGAALGWVGVNPQQRSGILTQAGLLAGFAHERSDAPVLRGVFVLDRLLCAPPPPPPVGVNTSIPDTEQSHPLTTRQKLEQSHVSATCAGCHKLIDGVGFGFENYDALGAFRTEEEGLPVDSRGELSGTDVDGPFDGAVALGHKLSASDTVRTCLTTQWLKFALAVSRADLDPCVVAPISEAFRTKGDDLHELLIATAMSDAFRLRPAP